jgi:hypothetical protein
VGTIRLQATGAWTKAGEYALDSSGNGNVGRLTPQPGTIPEGESILHDQIISRYTGDMAKISREIKTVAAI